MPSPTSIVPLVLAFVAGISLAWALGASSNSPPFAPAVAANALTTMRAAVYIGIFASLGAVIQGGSVSETISEGLISGTAFTPLAAAAALLTAAVFIATGVKTGYPIPAGFATTGAVVGAGLALGGDPVFSTYRVIVTFWLLVPIVGSTIGFTTASLLRHEDVPETLSIPFLGVIVGAVIANAPLAFIPGADETQQTIASYVSRVLIPNTPAVGGSYDLAMVVTTLVLGVLLFVAVRRSVRRSVDGGIRTFLIGLGALVAFSSGGSQVGLAVGPLRSTAQTQLQLPGFALLVYGAIGIILGAWMGAPRILQAVAHEYSELGTRRSIAALVPAFIITQTGILLGIPISLNNIVISSVIGSGLAGGTEGVSGRKIGFTAVAWIAALFSAGLVGFGFYRLLASVAGGA